MPHPYLSPYPKNDRVLHHMTQAINLLPGRRPTITSIAGPSGCGKTTLAKNLQGCLGSENCLVIDLDDYQYSRTQKRELGVSGQNPRGTKIDKARKDIQDLREARSVSKPRYDFKTGEILEEESVRPKRHIIFCGISAFFDGLVDMADYRILMDIPEDRLLKFKMKREVEERGYTPERVREYFWELQKDHRRYIETAKDQAEMVVEVGERHVLNLLAN
jgi:phosphoribulokinase